MKKLTDFIIAVLETAWSIGIGIIGLTSCPQ